MSAKLIVDSAIQAAKARGGTDAERATFALASVLINAEPILARLEKEYWRKVPHAAAVAYFEGQIELRYRLLKAMRAV